MSDNTFESLGVHADVSRALARRGIKSPLPIQSLVVEPAIEGSDILAQSRTGSGKTLAFGIPIVHLVNSKNATPSALVLVPTRELASQVAEEISDIASARGLRTAVAYGGVPLFEQGKKAAKSHILIATPGRLEDLADRRIIDLSGVRILVLDEADRMLDMGFQPQVDRIVRRLKGPRQTMFFSATLEGVVGQIASSYTKAAVRCQVESPKLTVEEVDHYFKPVTSGDKISALVELLRNERELALVFVRTKRGAERLSTRLKAMGITAQALHGDMTQGAREKAWARFQKGQPNVLIATDIAARGLDLDSISHVINFDPPEDEKAYVHRIGRTARAGRSGSGITLVLPDQHADVGRIAARLSLNEEFEREGLKVPAPQVAYSSHRGRNSMMGRRPRRKF